MFPRSSTELKKTRLAEIWTVLLGEPSESAYQEGVNLQGGDDLGRGERPAGRDVQRLCHQVLHASVVPDVEDSLAVVRETRARGGPDLGR